jgi:hypothetical protein
MRRCTHQFTRGTYEPLGLVGESVVVRYRATCAGCGTVVAQMEMQEGLGEYRPNIL